MDFGESIDVDISPDKHDSDCYFCNHKDDPVFPRTNNFSDDPSDLETLWDGHVSGSGKKHKNCASSLCKNMGGDPGTKLADVNAEEIEVGTAAHHLIPGNGSLTKSACKLHPKWTKSEGTAAGKLDTM